MTSETLTSEAPRCHHLDCKNPARVIEIPDNHDGYRGYRLTRYCSLACFVCDLKHAGDEASDIARVSCHVKGIPTCDARYVSDGLQIKKVPVY